MRALLAIALAAAACSNAPSSSESVAREAYVEQLAAREGLTDEWRLMSRGDLVFEDGWSRMLRIEPEPDQVWTDVTRTIASTRALPARWIGQSAHARVRGRGRTDMHLRIWGRVDRRAIFARPRVSLVVGSVEVASHLVADDGTFVAETVVPAGWITDWTDVYLELSTVGEPWRDPAVTRVARVEGVVWEPVR